MSSEGSEGSGAAFRIERDSMGEVRVPADALYAAQTHRACENFPYPASTRMPSEFIAAMAHVKAACAQANEALGLMDGKMASAIHGACDSIAAGGMEHHFPLTVYQTGSGTSTNMNVNEVIAKLAERELGARVHANDHVNMSQSSNDVVPTALSVAAYLGAHQQVLPALEHLQSAIERKAASLDSVVVTGRTHLMDAMPITMGQQLRGWATQVRLGRDRVTAALERVARLAIGGTAVGTGVNAHPEFGARVAAALASRFEVPFRQTDDFFESMSAQDGIVELHGQLKTVAVGLMKISNDLRWMNSGPIAGLADITLPALQPGSSIMPGKINPVVPESVTMVCATVMGHDTTVTVAGQSGNFQLNVMLPLLARCVLESEALLATAAKILADQAIEGFEVNTERVSALLDKNPILVTALNPVIGYEMGAKVAKEAFARGEPVKEVAHRLTGLPMDRLEALLDPRGLTHGGIGGV